MSSLKNNLDSLLAALLGFIIIIFFTRHGGIGISPDSVAYTSAAESFLNHGKLLDYSQEPLVDFPPFYPLFLAIISLITGSSPVIAGPYLNAFLFALLIFLSGLIMEKFQHRSRIYKACLLSCIVICPCLLEIYSMLWTETIFALWLLLFFLYLRRYFINYSRRALVFAGMIASLASITRYAGVTFIAAGTLFIFLDHQRPRLNRLKDILVFAITGTSLLILLFARNFILSGTLSGHREISNISLKENLQDSGIVFSGWMPFVHDNNQLASWVASILILLLAVIVLKEFLSYQKIATYENMASAFCLVYILFMIVVASISRFETLDSRFFSPIFIPLLWSLSYWILGPERFARRRLRPALILVTAFLFCAIQYRQVQVDLETWDGVKDAGIPGYTEDEWRNSKTIQFLQQDSLGVKKDYTIYSDAYDAIYFLTGKPGKFLPHKEMKDELDEFMEDRHCYLVWFNDGQNPDLVDLNFITKVKGMKLIRQFDDGAIYEYN